MTLMLELPPELEARLQDEAACRGVQVEEYALQILQSGVQEQTVGAAIVAEWQRAGVIGSRPDITDSKAHARMLRNALKSARGRNPCNALPDRSRPDHPATLREVGRPER